MTPLDKRLRRIAPAAAMAGDFGCKHKNTNKTQLLVSNNGTNQPLVVYENFIPQNEPSTQLIDATSCISLWDTTIQQEEHSYISSYQRLWADKNWKSY